LSFLFYRDEIFESGLRSLRTLWRIRPILSKGLSDVQNTKFCCGLFRTGLISSNRKQYYGPLLGDIGITSPKQRRGPIIELMETPQY